MSDTKPHNSHPPLGAIYPEGGNTTLKYVLFGTLGIVGYLKFQKWNDERLLKAQNEKAAEDNSSNIASQIHAENRATYTKDSKQIDLYRQITDYKKTQAAYLNASGGKDMLEDTRQHVSSGTYQQILNILGVKGGAIQASSQTANEVKSNPKKVKWVVAKVDARVRKSPKAGSAVFTLRPNVIGIAKAGSVIGVMDRQTYEKNGSNLFYDDENSTYFLPVLIFNNKDARKYYSAYVAVSTVTLYDVQPKQRPLFLISDAAYEQAYGVSGLEGESKTPSGNHSSDPLTNPLL